MVVAYKFWYKFDSKYYLRLIFPLLYNCSKIISWLIKDNFCIKFYTLLEVVELYQKKTRNSTRPTTAVNAKITKSNVFTDRSSTIFVRSWILQPNEVAKDKVQLKDVRFSIPNTRDRGCVIGIGIRRAPSRACSIAPLPRVCHVVLLHRNCAINHTVSLLGVKASSVRSEVSVWIQQNGEFRRQSRPITT